MSYSETYEARIKEASDKALSADVTDEERAEQERRCSAVFEWLALLEMRYSHPADYFSQLFGQSDYLSKGDPVCVLLSREKPEYMWEQTGFHYDAKIGAVCARVGSTPYQPIGFTDGKRYIHVKGAKPFWTRDFRFALLTHPTTLFKYTVEELLEDQYGSAVKVSKSEEDTITSILRLIEEDTAKYVQLEGPAKTDQEQKMRFSVEIMRKRVPRLDLTMKQFEAAHPELGESFKNSPVDTLYQVIADFLTQRLATSKVHSVMESADQFKSSEAGVDFLATIKELLSNPNLREGEAQVYLSYIESTNPEIMAGISENTPLSDAVQRVLSKLP